MRVVLFLSKKDAADALLNELGRLTAELLVQVPEVHVERVLIEEEPGRAQVLGVGSTPMTVIDQTRFPGVPTVEQVVAALGIHPIKERPFRTLHGTAFLIRGDRIPRAYHSFFELVRAGAPGLLVTARDRVAVPEDLAGKGVEEHRIGTTKGDRRIPATDLEQLVDVVGRFTIWNLNSVVLIDGLDALQEANGFKVMVPLLQIFRDFARSQNACIFVALDYGVSSEEEIEEFQRLLVAVT